MLYIQPGGNVGSDSSRIARDGSAPPSADIPWNSKKITGLGDPTNLQDADTKNARASAITTALAAYAEVSAKFTLSGTQAAAGSIQSILWDTEIFKKAGITHSTSSNKDQIAVDAAGRYLIGITYDPSATAHPILVGYSITGGAIKWLSTTDVTVVGVLNGSDLVDLAANDYIKWHVYTNQGAQSDTTCFIFKVGALATAGGSGGIAPESVFLRRATTFGPNPGATRIEMPWESNDLLDPAAGAMWPCPELGASQYNWVKIRSDGTYILNTHQYFDGGSGEFTVSFWKKKAGVVGQYADNEWLLVSNPSTDASASTDRWRERTLVRAFSAGDYVGVALQSGSAFSILVNPNPQGDDTRPDQRFVYPVFSVTKVCALPP